MTIGQLKRSIAETLECENSQFEAQQIIQSALGISRESYLLKMNDEVEQSAGEKCWQMADRRNDGEPLYYILGEAEFYSLTLKVSEKTLIPRQDSELIVDLALGYAKDHPVKKVCDLCSGTGAIGIAFHTESGVETDCVELYDAYDVLSENCEKYGCTAIRADALEYDLSGYDIITCNPPYIAESERETLSVEVLKEPETALFAEDDGLYFYKKIAKKPKSGSFIVFEIGYKQADAVSEILQLENYENITVHYDLCGNARAVTGLRKVD